MTKVVNDDATNTFTLANRLGTVETYRGFAAPNPGSLLAQTSPGGVRVSLSYASGQVSEMLRTYTDAAGVTTTESYFYDYIASGANAGLIASVLLRRSTSADGLWTNIRRALYTYYGSSSPDGNLNNLQTVTRQVPAGAADWHHQPCRSDWVNRRRQRDGDAPMRGNHFVLLHNSMQR